MNTATGPDKKFVIDPETAPTVRPVFDLYAQGQTITQIIRTLNTKGLRTKRGRPFTNNSLRTVLKNEHIVYFPHRFADMDYTGEACQKQLIKTFVNSVFVYDERVVLTFDCSGDDRTITLREIDAGLQQGVRLPRALFHHVGASSVSLAPTFFQKSERAYALIFLSKSNPLRWASI